MDGSLDIQPIQSTIFCSDKDIVTSESAFSNGHTRFGLIPISLCGVFFSGIIRKEGSETNINTILYVCEESKSLPIWLNPTEIAWSTWSTVEWPTGIFHVPKLESYEWAYAWGTRCHTCPILGIMFPTPQKVPKSQFKVIQVSNFQPPHRRWA